MLRPSSPLPLQGLAGYQEVRRVFPESHYVQSQMAIASYNMRDFNSAQNLFEKILKEDPYRLDNLDTYSNILYVREQKTQLSFVAHNALRNEKYRPETCCIVGNYYSLKSQHEKAVLYFKRALQLNHQYLSAWTLMGHEYVEMRNTAAAIEAYRRALDITQRDYRAWYSALASPLGMTGAGRRWRCDDDDDGIVLIACPFDSLPRDAVVCMRVLSPIPPCRGGLVASLVMQCPLCTD